MCYEQASVGFDPGLRKIRGRLAANCHETANASVGAHISPGGEVKTYAIPDAKVKYPSDTRCATLGIAYVQKNYLNSTGRLLEMQKAASSFERSGLNRGAGLPCDILNYHVSLDGRCEFSMSLVGSSTHNELKYNPITATWLNK